MTIRNNTRPIHFNRMKYPILCFLVLATICFDSFSQAKTRKLSSSINHPSLNLFAPFISSDGNAMLFLTDNTEDGILTPFYTFRDATDWKAPQVFPKNLHSRVSFVRGYGINADGRRIFLTTQKAPSVGGFDIWYSDWKGTAWSEPANFGAPVNSKGHDACPSVTPDGNTMYFMRCQTMDVNKAGGCKIFSISKKPNGQWAEAVELPAEINTGNSQTPRIMADGETLYFSSDKITPNKGGMDLYVSRLKDGTWSSPEPLDFANTEKDDQYVSAGGLGRYLLKDAFGGRKNEIVEYLIPESKRPRGMMKIEGKVTDQSGAPTVAYIAAYDLLNGKLFYNSKPSADGSFILYLKEGSRYDLSIEPEHSNLTYFSKTFDLTTDKIPQWEKVTAIIKPVTPGDEFTLEQTSFKPMTSELDMSVSTNELKRLNRLLVGNPQAKAEVQVMLKGYEEDSVQSAPDLTEVIYDSIASQYQIADTAGVVVSRDTVIVKTLYHNNRTEQQAMAIAYYFVSQGIPAERFSIITNAIPASTPEEKKLLIKILIR
jgi:hypothetical protein